MESKFVCPCGLVCCDCLFYKPGIYETAAKLKTLIKDSQFDVFLDLITKKGGWKVIAGHVGKDAGEAARYQDTFEKMPEFMQVLDEIIGLQCKTTCREAGGCSIGGVTRKCEALTCVESKGYNGCWDCGEADNCGKLAFVKRSYGKTIEENFRTIREKGVSAVESRGNKYYAWQRK